MLYNWLLAKDWDRLVMERHGKIIQTANAVALVLIVNAS